MDNLSDVLGNAKVDERLLFKHVATIHKVNSLTLLQNKVSNVLYFHAYKNLKTQDLHIISMKELCNYLSYKGHNYAEIKNALLGLINLVVQWNTLNDVTLEGENWSASTALASASIKTNGIIEYSYSYHMRELLADPKVYATINIAYQSNFRSKYGLALYENCVRYVNVKQTPWFKYALLRNLLGVAEGKYGQYKDFKRRVLDAAIEEVNTCSDIRVEPLFKKVARCVSEIKFGIARRKKKEKIVMLPIPILNKPALQDRTDAHGLSSQQIELVDILKRGFQLSAQQALWVVKSHSVDYIHEKITFVQSYGGAKSLCAILIAALKNDYKKNVSLRTIEKQQFEKVLQEHEQLKLDVFHERLLIAKKRIGSASLVEDFLHRFDNYLRAEYAYDYVRFSKKGILIENRSRQLCYKFCAEKFPTVFDLVKNLEE